MRQKAFFSTLNLVMIIAGLQAGSTLLSYTFPALQNQPDLLVLPIRVLQLAISIIVILWTGGQKLKLQPVQIVLIIFWGCLLARFFYDMFIRRDVFVASGIIYHQLISIVFVTLIPMYSVMNSYRFVNFQQLFNWVVIIYILSVFFVYINNEDFQSLEDMGRIEANSAMNTINTGHMALSAIILSIYSVIFNKGLFIRFFCLGGAIVASLIMLRSGSRGPLLGLIGIVGIVTYSISKNNARGLLISLSLFIIGYFAIEFIIDLIEQIAPTVVRRITDKAENGGQLNDRLFLYEYAYDAFLESPFIGKNFAIYIGEGMVYSHNFMLDTMMQLGIVGTVMMIYIVWKSLQKTVCLVRERKIYGWLALLMMQSFFKMLVSGAFYQSAITTIIIMLIFLPLEKENQTICINGKING